VVWGLRPDGVVNVGEAQAVQAHDSGVTALAWSQHDLLASGGFDGGIALWQVSPALRIRAASPYAALSGHTQRVSSLSWSPSEDGVLASASWDGTLALWNTSTGQQVSDWTGHAGEVHSLAYSLDGGLLASGGADRMVRLWAATSGAPTEVAALEGHSDEVRCLAWAASGVLASGALDDTVRVWDLRDINRRSGASTNTIPSAVITGHSRGITAISWSPNSSFLATGSWDETIRVWTASQDSALSFDPVPAEVVTGQTGGVWAVEWAPASAGGYLASSSGSENSTVHLWAVPADVQPDVNGPDEGAAPQAGPVQTVPEAESVMLAWAPDGRSLARVPRGNVDSIQVSVVSAMGYIDASAPVISLTGHSAPISALVWLPSGSMHALASAARDDQVRLWLLGGGSNKKPAMSLVARGPPMWAVSLAWTPAGLLAGSWDGTLRLVHTNEVTLRNGEAMRASVLWSRHDDSEWLRHLPEMQVVWSSGGSHFAVRDGPTIRGWSVGENGTTEAIATSRHPGQDNFSVAVRSASGKFLAAADADAPTISILRLVDSDNGYGTAWEPVQMLNGHAGVVTSLAWQPHSTRLVLASGSADGAILLWATDSPRDNGMHQLSNSRQLDGHAGAVSALAWHPRNDVLASGGADGDVLIWLVDDAESNDKLRPSLLEGHSGAVLAVAWSPTGDFLGSSSEDSTLRIWAAQRSSAVQVRRNELPVVSLAWSPTGQFMAALDRSGDVFLWGVENAGPVTVAYGKQAAEPAARASSTRKLGAIAWSPDGTQLALVESGTYSVLLWNVSELLPAGSPIETPQWQGRPPRPMLGHTNPVRALAWDPTGTLLASGADDARVIIWDAAGRDVIPMTVLTGHAGSVQGIAWAPTRDLLASADHQAVRLWAVLPDGRVDGAAVQVLQSADAAQPVSIAWSPAGAVLADTGGSSGALRLWRDLRAHEMRPYLARLLFGRNLTITEAELARWGIPRAVTAFPELLRLQPQD